jgi:2-dehydropantoate 2-reductase
VRILVVGAGAIGGYFGSRLLAAGRDVTFLVRARRAEQLRRSGMIVKSPLGDLKMPTPALASAGSIQGHYDLVILSCKSYDLDSSIQDFAAALGPKSLVLPLLNGMRHLEVLDARFGAARVLGGLARISGTLDGEGTIHHMGQFQAVSFGARRSSASDIASVAAALQAPGFEAHLSADITHDMWEKWVFIAAAAATTSLMRATVGDIVDAGAQSVPTGLLDECASIATESGFAPGPASMKVGLSVLTTPGSGFTASMLRDIEQGSRIEADHIVGDLLRRRSTAIKAPLLSTAYLHLKAYEARRERQQSAATPTKW